MTTDENIHLAIRNACRSNSRCSTSKKEAVAYTKMNYNEVFAAVKDIMVSQRMKTSQYNIFVEYDPKLRLIFCLPFFYDRIIHHCLLNVLSPIWDKQLFAHSYSCREGLGQHKAGVKFAEYARKYKYCLMMDISQFYMSIPHYRMKEILKRKIKDPIVLAFLFEIIDSVDARRYSIEFYRKHYNQFRVSPDIAIGKLEHGLCEFGGEAAGMPVGNHPSQWCGNLYMNEGDDYLLQDIGFTDFLGYCDNRAYFSNNKFVLHEISKKMTEFYHDDLHLLLSENYIRPTDCM